SNDFKVLELLNSNPLAYSISKEDIPQIERFLKAFFPKMPKFPYNRRTHLSIIHASKFSRYFPSTLKESDIPNIEFSRARSGNQEEFFSKISSWVSDGKDKYELLEKFLTIKDFDDKDDFERVIGGLVCVYKKLVEFKDFSDLSGGKKEEVCYY